MDATIPKNEESRQQALDRYGILDTPPEETFDDIAQLVAFICDTPMATITFVDRDRQWFKSKVGVERSESERRHAFCAHAIHETSVMIVNDATTDKRFCDNPFVTGESQIRFYAGAPLLSSDGFALGTLCVLDRQARTLTPAQISALERLARQVTANLELRLVNTKLRAMNESKTRLFAILAHDLRAPFTPILGFSQLLKENIDILPATEVVSFAESIHRNAEHVFQFVQDLLTWSKHELGALNFKQERILGREFFAEILALFRGNAEQKEIVLSLEYSGEEAFLADKNMFATVVRNLLSNALKFTHRGGRVQLIVSVEKAKLEFCLIDNGNGIAEEDREKLFQVDSHFTTLGTAQEKGSGLGLPLCKDFVERHQGRIEVESEVGVGTTFRVHIPQTPVELEYCEAGKNFSSLQL